MKQKIINDAENFAKKSDLEIIEIAKKLLSPKNDFVFKKIFGEHKEICKNFIESVTGLHINSLEYGNTESLGDIFGSKKMCFDVNVILDTGVRINIEMQIEDKKENTDRFALYAARYHGAQLKTGQDYTGVTKTILIHIFDYIFLDKNRYKNSVNKYQMLHVTEHTILSDTLDVYTIELPKIPKVWHNECEKWLFWINDREDAVKKGVTLQNQQIADAEDAYNAATSDPAMQMAYVSVLKAIYREKASLHDAKQEGEEMGIKKGREEGKREGMLEAYRQTAKALKSLGYPYDAIIKSTGLTKEEIDNL